MAEENKNAGKQQKMSNPQTTLKLADLLLGRAQEKYISSSLSDTLHSTQEKIIESMKASTAVTKSIKDSYGNSLTATGTDDKVKSFTKYGFSNDTLNWTLWTALYNDSWLFKKAIDKIAEDMVDAGIELKGKADKKDAYKLLNELSQSLIKFIKWGRLYGGSIAVLQFDNFDDKDYQKPAKDTIEKIKNAKKIRLYVTDRWYGVAEVNSEKVNDMSSEDFGKPIKYNITFANGKTHEVMHDYVLRYENRDAPNLVKLGMLQGWGYAEGAHILNELSRDDQLKSAITSLVNKSLIEVIKMAGMRSVFMGADSENEEQLTKRLEMVNWGRTFNSLTFLDIDDEYQEHGFGGLGGLSDLLENNMVLVSAAVDMPGVLFGDLSQGFAVDKDAMKRYAGVVHNQAEASFRTPMTKLLKIIYLNQKIDEAVDFDFKSLIADQLQDEKLEKLKEFQSLCSNLMSDGILDVKLYAKAFRKYCKDGTIDFGLDDKEIDKLAEEAENELESIDLSGVK